MHKEIEAGICFNANDAKSTRCGKTHLNGSYIKIENLIAYIYNVTINSEDKKIMLLLHKKEIIQIYNKLKENYVAIPMYFYKKDNLIKCHINIMKYDRSLGKDIRKLKNEKIYKSEKNLF